MILEGFNNLLASTALAHIATIGPAGEPQTNQTGFVWDGTSLRFVVSPDRHKFRNLVREPRIAVSIVDPDNPGHYFEIRGVARVETDPDPAFVATLVGNYTGNDTMPGAQGERKVIAIEPIHITHMG